MTSMDDFEKSLKEVVSAKRLSGSKMTALTETSMKLMEHDTQLVAILARTHKSLPASNKISSLYVIDAICRAARHHANKHRLTAESGKANSASFLTKFETMLDTVFQDMLQNAGPEGKEKSKKIVDIWTKGNTFPGPVLSRLSERIKDPDKDSKPLDPRTGAAPASTNVVPSLPLPTSTPIPNIPTPPSAPSAVTDAQQALLQLLAQAAGSGQPIPSLNGALMSAVAQSPAHQPPLPIAIPVANGIPMTAPGPPQPPPMPHSGYQQPYQVGSGPPAGPSIPRRRDYDNDYGSGSSSHHNGNASYDAYDNHDAPSGYRGGYRGGFRGRGRGRGGYSGSERGGYGGSGGSERNGYGGPRDDRDRYTREPRKSRSRSPPRYGGNGPGGARRDSRPYSPPNRPSASATSPPHQTMAVDPRKAVPSVETDEFGREIRLASDSPPPPASTVSESSMATPPPVEITSSGPPAQITPANGIQPVIQNRPPVAPPTAPRSSFSNPAQHHRPIQQQPETTGPGLETFDITTFNPVDPTSWSSLGARWKVSFNGQTPGQEEIMQFVMLVQSGQMTPTQIVTQYGGSLQQQQQQQQQHWGMDGMGAGMAGGRANQTDAVVIGGSEEDDLVDDVIPSDSKEGSVGGGGSMQKVDGRWVFVKGTASVNS
ncbi:hypothetical protein DL96DRAFT_1523421 [Flagelloscypha sp. PMI_526]|nr:hypothetical protein DL96DRAFT_1523421 [Flagelloscypha sp. PMI_526]